jgi:hypothetical protein
LNAEVLARTGKLDKLGVPTTRIVSAKAVAVTA